MTIPGAAPEWTYSEYARLPDDGNRYEVIDGEVCVTPESAAGVTDRGVEDTPGLVVEVLSPHSKRIDRIKKPPRYRDFGVPEYWVVDPVARTIERYRLAADAAPEIVHDVLVWQPSPQSAPLRLDVQTIFPTSAGDR